NLDARSHGAEVFERVLQAHAVVRQPARPGKAGAGGGQRAKAELLEHARTAQIPRIGNDEATRRVQLAKDAIAVRGLGHLVALILSGKAASWRMRQTSSAPRTQSAEYPPLASTTFPAGSLTIWS